jgi:RNA polymerase sigma factor (TIGR02999 family)
MPLIYAELGRIAENHLRRERLGHTLQPTALVHEAYLRLIGQDQPDYRSRAHFLGVAAHVRRQMLVDHARSRGAGKRGSGGAVLSLNESIDASIERPVAAVARIEDMLGIACCASLVTAGAGPHFGLNRTWVFPSCTKPSSCFQNLRRFLRTPL